MSKWQDEAACIGTDPDAYFPETHSDQMSARTINAKKLCGGCPVVTECLTHALENDERDGIWGGLSPVERARLRRAVA